MDGLPVISDDVIRAYCAQIVRDKSIKRPEEIGESLLNRMKMENLILFDYCVRIAEGIIESDGREFAASYMRGFADCYNTLARQIEVDDLEMQAKG